RKSDVNLHVSPGDAAFDGLSQGSFKWIELGRQMEVKIEGSVVDALHAQYDLALGDRLAYPGEAGHAPDVHWSTIASNSINCRSCSRWYMPPPLTRSS